MQHACHFSSPFLTQISYIPLYSHYLLDSIHLLPKQSKNSHFSKSQLPMGTTEAILPESKIRIFFFPYITSGHFHPMLDMAAIFSSSSAATVSSTIIVTPSNAHLTSPHFPTHILPLPPTSNLPDGWDSISSPTSSSDFHTINASLSLLYTPLLNLLKSDPPHCLVSDSFLPWTADVAAELGIPRIVFDGMSSYSKSVIKSIKEHRPHDSVVDDGETFVVPMLPRPVTMTRSQLPEPLRAPTRFNRLMDRMDECNSKSYGVLVNSFYELETEFAQHFREKVAKRAWHVGPVFLSNKNRKGAGGDRDDCLKWLDSKKPGSVLYVCFGSQAQLTARQLNELGSGLVSSKHHFIWVVKEDSPEIWLEGDSCANKKGLVIRGWAPQVRILNHESVGGFLTHCGWNSVLEGVSAGKPMVTWPVFGDQPFNEKLVVSELKIGARVGGGIGDGETALVTGEEIATAVERVMGGGKEAMEMRRKAEKLGEEARGAVKEGGSSWKDANRLIEDLMSLNKKFIIC